MIIMGLDVATNTGIAIYDTKEDVSSIHHFSKKVTSDESYQKAIELVGLLRHELDFWKPDFVAIEAPLTIVRSYNKKRNDMLGITDKGQTINPAAVIVPNMLFGSAVGAVTAHFGDYTANAPLSATPPRVWQSKLLKGVVGKDTKDRAKIYLEACGITGGNNDGRDAACLAIYAKIFCQRYAVAKIKGGANG